MTPDDVIEAVGRLKSGFRDGQRLPHKPLLLLLALGRWASGDRGPIPFADVEKKLTALNFLSQLLRGTPAALALRP